MSAEVAKIVERCNTLWPSLKWGGTPKRKYSIKAYETVGATISEVQTFDGPMINYRVYAGSFNGVGELHGVMSTSSLVLSTYDWDVFVDEINKRLRTDLDFTNMSEDDKELQKSVELSSELLVVMIDITYKNLKEQLAEDQNSPEVFRKIGALTTMLKIVAESLGGSLPDSVERYIDSRKRYRDEDE